MPTFPTGFSDRLPSRLSKLLGDTGTENGNFVIRDLLDLFQLGDLPPGVNVGDIPTWDGQNWVFGNPPKLTDLTGGGAVGDTNVFRSNQGGVEDVKLTMAQLFTYIYAKLLQSNGSVEDVQESTGPYTFVLADKNKTKRFLTNADITVSVPTGQAVGASFGWIAQGTGILSFQSVSGAGQTIQSAAGLRSGARYARGALTCVAANTWNLSGYTQA